MLWIKNAVNMKQIKYRAAILSTTNTILRNIHDLPEKPRWRVNIALPRLKRGNASDPVCPVK